MPDLPEVAHPPIPVGTATKAGYGGAVAGIALGVVGWIVDQTLNPEDVVLMASGIGSLIAIVAGRSAQAKEAIRAFAQAYLKDTGAAIPAGAGDVDPISVPDPVQSEAVVPPPMGGLPSVPVQTTVGIPGTFIPANPEDLAK